MTGLPWPIPDSLPSQHTPPLTFHSAAAVATLADEHRMAIIRPVGYDASRAQMQELLREATQATRTFTVISSIADWVDRYHGNTNTKKKLVSATGIAEIVFALGELGMPRTAKRVDYLARLHDDGEPEIDLDSLRRLVNIMIDNPKWGEPALTLSDEGCMHAEWGTKGGGRVSMTFLPSHHMDYAAISAPATSPEDVLNIGGHHIEQEAVANLRWFTDRIVAR